MWLSAADQKKYPKFAAYLRASLPQVANVPLIAKNMEKFGFLNIQQLRHALMWGTEPTVIVKDLSTGSCGGVVANGCFDPARPTRIEIDLERVQDFETDMWGKGADVTKYGKPVIIVGTTVLHEMCHWGVYHANVSIPYEEEGISFEEATYGRNIG